MTRNREQQGLGSFRVELESNASNISHSASVLIEANSNTMRRLCNHWKMFIINLITTVGMIIISTFALSRAMRVQNATTEAITNLELTFSLSEIAKILQRERGISTMFLANENVTLATISKLAVHRKNIDRIVNFINWDLNDIKLRNDEWKVDDMIYSLKQHRSKVDNRTIELDYNLEYYTKLTTSLIKYITNSVTMSSDSLIQRSIDASNALLALTDDVGIQRALGSTFFSGCGWPTIHIRNNFLHLHGRSSAYLEVAIGYNEKVEIQYIHAINSSSFVSDFIDRYLTYELFIGYVTSCKSLSKIQKEAEGLKWFQNMTVYIDIYFEIREKMNRAIKHSLDDLHEKAQRKFVMYFTTLLLVVIISCIMSLWYTYNIANLTGNLVEYIKKEKQRSTELVKAKKKSEHILFQMVPKKIAKDLKLGRALSAEHFNDVTIYFSNICGFTEIRSKSKPMEIISTLNDICSLFDECIDKYDAYKVVTLGDIYMAVSGAPTPNDKKHAAEIASMALLVNDRVKRYTIPHLPVMRLALKTGIHSGSCVAGVIGTKMPRYCLFGDTVNTASCIESTSIGERIQISSDTQSILESHGKFVTEFRGEIEIQGKGLISTYWLNGVKIEDNNVVISVYDRINNAKVEENNVVFLM